MSGLLLDPLQASVRMIYSFLKPYWNAFFYTFAQTHNARNTENSHKGIRH